MTHPDLDRLTAWVHGLLDPAEARETEEHVAACDACGGQAERVRAEVTALARAIAPPAALREGLLRRAGARPSRGLAWQIPLAAAVLFGLVGLFLFPGSGHRLEAGRVALEEGGDRTAPADLSSRQVWRLRALEKARLRLSDRSLLEAAAGARVILEPGGERGVRAEVAEGEVLFEVRPAEARLRVRSPGGEAASGGGTFRLKIVGQDEGGTPMKGITAGVLVTVLAGSVALSNAEGQAVVTGGRSAALMASSEPLLVTSSQDPEGLLRRLEQLAGAIARLEEEIGRLETRNKQLKAQLESNSPGGRVWFGGAGGAAPGPSLQLELKREEPKKEK